MRVTRCAFPVAVLLFLLLVAGCGSGSGGFPTTSPVSDVCSLLKLSEAQSLVPTVDTFGVEPSPDTPDAWSRICHYSNSQTMGPFTDLDLVIQGALTEKGAVGLQSVLTTGLGTSHTAVSGVGEQAVFFDESGSDQGLFARSRGYMVDVTVYFANPAVTSQQLAPLVNAAISRLP